MLTRRAAIASGGAALAACTLSQPVLGQGPLSEARVLRPPRLKPGDTVGLIEPASATFEPFDLQLIEEVLGALDLKVKHAGNLLSRHGYLAGEDKARAAGVNAMFRDRAVNAIMAVRGGWGSARILPYLDFDSIRSNPKPLIGYSDITALHLAIHARTRLVTFHGPNGASAWGRRSVQTFHPLLFDAAMPVYANPVADEDRLTQRLWRTQTIREGIARGRLIGGNLTVMTALVGTPYLPSFAGAILFIEDVGEAIYRVDRMLTQMQQAGLLKGLNGVIVGHCTNCDAGSGDYGSFTLGEVLEAHLAPLKKPAYRGAFIGHLADQFTIPVGGMIEMDASAGSFRLLEPAVT